MPITTVQLRHNEINFARISGLAVNKKGHIFVADYVSSKLFRLEQASDGLYDLFDVGEQFENPRGLLLDGEENMYVANTCQIQNLTLTSTGSSSHQLTLVTRNKNFWPFQIAIDPTTNHVYFTERQKSAFVRKINPNGQIENIGCIPFVMFFNGFADGPYDQAIFRMPSGIVINSLGEIFVSDAGNHCIRKLFQGQVSTIAGCPQTKGYLDGDAKQALFDSPAGLALDHKENLIIADYKNKRIRKLNFQTNKVTTIAGSGATGRDDGQSLQASFSLERVPFLVTHHQGAIYIADNSTECGRIRVLEPLPWKVARLLWIGHMKSSPECPFSLLPREILRLVMQHYAENEFELLL